MAVGGGSGLGQVDAGGAAAARRTAGRDPRRSFLASLVAAACLDVARRPAAGYVAPLSLLVGLPLGGAMIALTGGAESPGALYSAKQDGWGLAHVG